VSGEKEKKNPSLRANSNKSKGAVAHLVVIVLVDLGFITYKCEISTTREAAQVGTTTIVEAKAVETRKGVGRETDTTREIEAEAGSVTQTAHEIETGIVAATASYLIMSMS
jgi:hypothetical protein